MQERSDERSGVVPGSRMNNHSRRLVDDSDVRILVENFERNFLRLNTRRWRRRNFNGYGFARGDAVRWLPGNSIDRNATFIHECLDVRSAHLRKMGGEKAIEALALMIGGDD